MARAHQAAFFDFGGTLFSYTPMRERFDQLLVDTAAEHGCSRPAKELRRLYAEASAPVMARYAQQPRYLHRDLFADSAAAFVRALDAEPRPDLGERFYAGQTEVARPLIRPREGAVDTLVELRARGLHVGIVSNIDDDQFAVLWELCGLGHLVDATTTSEQARSCKPDARIFERALALAGHPDPRRTVFVGDSLIHDITGAKALGMTAIYMAERPLAPDSPVEPDLAIARLADLLPLVS